MLPMFYLRHLRLKTKVKKGEIFFLNQVAETIRSFMGEVGSNPNPDRVWMFEYTGDLKTDFMEGLTKLYQKNPAVPMGGI